MIKFIQHPSPKYPPRTYENASADATIAFAFDFNTAGERLTKDAVESQKKMYISIPPLFSSHHIDKAIHFLNKVNAKTINIAGNGAYTTVRYGYDQAGCDEVVKDFMNILINRKELSNEITLIRSGGQSGFDEAGLKAAVKFNIPALCVCPLGWKYKDINGVTICDEKQFKSRFAGITIL